METFEKLLDELSELELSAGQMRMIRGGDGPIDPPQDPPDPAGGK